MAETFAPQGGSSSLQYLPFSSVYPSRGLSYNQITSLFLQDSVWIILYSFDHRGSFFVVPKLVSAGVALCSCNFDVFMKEVEPVSSYSTISISP